MPRNVAYRVQVDVQAWTPQGVHYHHDLMGDLVAIRTSKTTAQPSGTFTLTFTMREDRQGSWADKLPFRTYVEIRAGTGDGTPPILMRGLVDSAGQTLTMPPFPQGPQRQVVVTGRDLGAILADWQVLYLWGIDPMATYLNAFSPNPNVLAAQLGIATGVSDPTTILTAFVQELVGKAVQGLQKFMPVPAIQPAITIPSAYQVNFTALQPWQGSYSNFLDYFASPPWGEDFYFDAPDAPQIIVRQTPYKEYTTGQYPLPFGGTPDANGFFPDTLLMAGDITGHNLVINSGGNQVYTYYLTIPDLASAFAQTQATWYEVDLSGQLIQHQSQAEHVGSNPYFDPRKAALWGIRPLQLTTPWISNLNQLTVGGLPAQMNTWLVNVFKDNDKLVSGTIQCHGNESLTVGRYVVVTPGTITRDPHAWEGYIEQVDHTINISANNASWLTTLGVVRGRVRTA